MPTLAEMLGGIEYPAKIAPQSKYTLGESDEPLMMRQPDEMALMVRMVDLEEGILAQSAIGK